MYVPSIGTTLWDGVSVLPNLSPGILGTIPDGSPLRRRILEWLDHPSKLALILPTSEGSIHPLVPSSVESVGAAEAVSWAIGHNPGRVATPTQDTRMAQSSPASWHSFCRPRKDDRLSQPHLVLIQQPSGVFFNSGLQDPKPATLTIKPTPGIVSYRSH